MFKFGEKKTSRDGEMTVPVKYNNHNNSRAENRSVGKAGAVK